MSRLPAPATTPVLLVEDNDDLRDALARLLRLRGHQVLETRDAEEAWAYLTGGGEAAVIVLDLNLPGLTGRQFRVKLLEYPEHARIPVIIFTSMDEDGIPAVTAYIRKANPQALIDAVDQTAPPAWHENE